MKFRRDRRDGAKGQLAHLHRKHGGLCHICGQPVDLAATGPEAANRFRVGSSFGRKGRVRPRVLVHRKCSDQRSNEIQNSIAVDARRDASGAFPLTAGQLADVLYHFGHGEKTDASD